MKFPKVGVVVLTYNSQNYIKKCLKSLLKNDYPSFTCVVIDNSSTDKTFNIVHKKFPKVKTIKNISNKGFAAGNNIGIRYLLKKKNISYILILNPDTLIDTQLISKLVSFMEQRPDAGITGPIMTYSQKPDTIWFAGGYLNRLFCYTKHPYMNKNIKHTGIHSSMTDFISGACMMIRVEVLKKTGLLPEEYFMYFEDVDFCQKVTHAGYSCYLLAEPLVKHTVSSSTGKSGTNDLTSFRAYYYARNPFIYIHKSKTGLIKLTNYSGQLFLRMPYYIIRLLIKGKLRSILKYTKGVIHGVINNL